MKSFAKVLFILTTLAIGCALLYWTIGHIPRKPFLEFDFLDMLWVVFSFLVAVATLGMISQKYSE